MASETSGADGVLCHANLAWYHRMIGETTVATDLLREATRRANELGTPYWQADVAMRGLVFKYERGDWDAVTCGADRLLADLTDGRSAWWEAPLRTIWSRIALARGDADRARKHAVAALGRAEISDDPNTTLSVQLWNYRVRDALNLHGAETAELGRTIRETWSRAPLLLISQSTDIAVCASLLGFADELRAAAKSTRISTPWIGACSAYAAGDYATAARLYAEIGSHPNYAEAELGQARQLYRDGHPGEASTTLARSLEMFRRLGATRSIKDAKAVGSGAVTDAR